MGRFVSVGRYSTWITWDPSGAMAEGQKCDSLQSLTWPWALHQWQGRATLGSWCSLGSAGCPRPGCSQVCTGILEVLQHLKWCWALKGAQLHLVPSISQSYQNAASCQKWRCCVLVAPQHMKTPWNQAQVKQINHHCARESLQYP